MGLGDRISSSVGNTFSRIRAVLKHKTDQVYISVIGLFCATIAGVYVYEFVQPEPDLIRPETFKIQENISLDKSTTYSLTFYRVEKNSSEWPAMEESAFNKLGEENMFDPKAVNEAAESVEGARDALHRAEASEKEGDLVAALRWAKEAERLSPGLAGAKALIRRIQEAQSEE